MPDSPDKQALRERATALGIDLVGVCDWHALEADAPEHDKPSAISTYLSTLVVLGRRYPTGVACSPDAAQRQYSLGRTARHLEESTAALAYWMEEHDCITALLSAVIPDLRRQPLGYSAPAGQGSRLLRLGAVAAGLGTLGLNRMLLTPQFGPRLFLTGIITDLSLAFDSPLDDELCPGLEGCGRCAAVCPAAAIPLEAPLGAALSEVRDLDLEACVEESQPYGPLRMVRHFEEIFASPSGEAAGEVIRRPETQQLFFNLTVLRQGSFTGCARCELVCPLGEDYAEIESSASRRGDLPEDLAPVVDGEVVRVSAYGQHRTG